MEKEEMILANDFCIHHNIELSFIHSLHESGLIEVIIIEEKIYVPVHQLTHLEMLVRFYFDMDINLPGIETITHLLQRVNDLQRQVSQLNNRLRIYEN